MLAVGLAALGIAIAAGLTLRAFQDNMMFFVEIVRDRGSWRMVASMTPAFFRPTRSSPNTMRNTWLPKSPSHWPSMSKTNRKQ
jgi:hypothetical protein